MKLSLLSMVIIYVVKLWNWCFSCLTVVNVIKKPQKESIWEIHYEIFQDVVFTNSQRLWWSLLNAINSRFSFCLDHFHHQTEMFWKYATHGDTYDYYHPLLSSYCVYARLWTLNQHRNACKGPTWTKVKSW